LQSRITKFLQWLWPTTTFFGEIGGEIGERPHLFSKHFANFFASKRIAFLIMLEEKIKRGLSPIFKQ